MEVWWSFLFSSQILFAIKQLRGWTASKRSKSFSATLIFFLFLQTKPSFCRLFAWSQIDFSAIHSCFNLWISTYILILQKTSEKNSCFCLCSFCFLGRIYNSSCRGRPHRWICNDIGRNSLLGNGKNSKIFNKEFPCHSTFLYAFCLRLLGPCVRLWPVCFIKIR